MALTITTTVAAISSTIDRLTVASATGITALTTMLQIGDEKMGVVAVNGVIINVRRGQFGTRAVAHGASAPVVIAPLDDLGRVGADYNPRFSTGLFYPTTYPVTITTAGVVTYAAEQLLAGLLLRDPNGAGRSDVTPTAALLVAAMPGCTKGTSFMFVIRNDADAAETITVTAGTGATLSGTMTIAQSNSKLFLVRITENIPGAETYTVYSLGTVVH